MTQGDGNGCSCEELEGTRRILCGIANSVRGRKLRHLGPLAGVSLVFVI